MYAKFTRGKENLRSVQTADHSRFWQSGRPFHRFIHQCQQVGFASRQSECLAGHAECSRHTCPSPEEQFDCANGVLRLFGILYGKGDPLS